MYHIVDGIFLNGRLFILKIKDDICISNRYLDINLKDAEVSVKLQVVGILRENNS